MGRFAFHNKAHYPPTRKRKGAKSRTEKAAGERGPQIEEGQVTKKAKPEPMSVQMEFVEGGECDQLFIVVDGKRIAERGPNRTWVSLRPGWEVIDTDDGRSVEIIVGEAFH